MEIEKQIAFDNNNLASFRKKWATFKKCPSENNNLIYAVLSESNGGDKRADGAWRTKRQAASSVVIQCFIDCSIFVDFVFLFIFISLFSPCNW